MLNEYLMPSKTEECRKMCKVTNKCIKLLKFLNTRCCKLIYFCIFFITILVVKVVVILLLSWNGSASLKSCVSTSLWLSVGLTAVLLWPIGSFDLSLVVSA